jgi:hypothetical protein
MGMVRREKIEKSRGEDRAAMDLESIMRFMGFGFLTSIHLLAAPMEKDTPWFKFLECAES